MSARIFLYSPIPPMRTGTASYLTLVVDELFRWEPLREAVTLVIDSDHLTAPVETFRGFTVRDFRSIPNVFTSGDLVVFFLANNEFHGYVARVLSQMPEASSARIITIVHEPSTFMLLNKLSGDGIHTFGRAEQIDNLELQYGGKAGKLVNDLNAGALPKVVEYVSVGIASQLQKSSEIWCHSAFAIAKLALETRIAATEMPRIRLVSHPLYRLGDHSRAVAFFERLRSKKKGFRIGLFGWCSPNKLIVEFIRGFGLFLDRCSPEQRDSVELIIVGHLFQDHEYPVRAEIARLDLQEYVHTYGHVDDETFGALVRTCDLIGNLRFPSCGETSGTLSHAHEAGAQIIVSTYQSFAEEIADYRIPVLPVLQPMLIAGAISTCFKRWAGGIPHNAESRNYGNEWSPELPAGTDRLLALECACLVIKNLS